MESFVKYVKIDVKIISGPVTQLGQVCRILIGASACSNKAVRCRALGPLIKELRGSQPQICQADELYATRRALHDLVWAYPYSLVFDSGVPRLATWLNTPV
jgi:hypothetical protein